MISMLVYEIYLLSLISSNIGMYNEKVSKYWPGPNIGASGSAKIWEGVSPQI